MRKHIIHYVKNVITGSKFPNSIKFSKKNVYEHSYKGCERKNIPVIVIQYLISLF